MTNPPKHLQGILWSTDINDLDLERDKWYIIHQVLIYGSFSDINWLFKTYSKRDVINLFVNRPSQTYPKKVFHFVKNYVLGLENQQLDKDAYVTSIKGPVKPRAFDRYLQKYPTSPLALRYKVS